MEVTTFGKKASKQQAAIESLKDLKTPEELLDKVVAADPDEVAAMAVAARPLFDYAFFEKLTARIDASSGAERDRLTRLRTQISDVTAKMDEAARTSLQDATSLLQELMSSDNPRTAVREHAAELDDAFMAVLSANLQEAERRGRKAAFERLAMIYEELMAMVEESQPPEAQLINHLLRAPYPDGVRELLREAKDLLTPEVLQLMDDLAANMDERAGQAQTDEERQEATETAKRLRDIKAQAMLLA